MLTPIIQTTGYVLSPDRSSTLLLHRNARPDDVHAGRYLAPGGHVERDEHIVDGMRRELREETGLDAESLVLRGSVLWTDWGPKRQDLLCFVFRIDAFGGTQLAECDEGTLTWVPLDKLGEVPMWESDHEWLPMVFDDDPRQFHGHMPHDGDRMLGWTYSRI